jgi:hypothetical protein
MADGQPTAPRAVAWEAAPDASFADALTVGADVLSEAATALPTLPSKDLASPFPATLSDAIALVHAREDAKKRQGAHKSSKSKSKRGEPFAGPGQEHYPGARQGGGDLSAFWMYMEVRRG